MWSRLGLPGWLMALGAFFAFAVLMIMGPVIPLVIAPLLVFLWLSVYCAAQKRWAFSVLSAAALVGYYLFIAYFGDRYLPHP